MIFPETVAIFHFKFNFENGLILPTGQWYAPSAVIIDALIMRYLELSCTILHIRYTCSQQMSPVIAFDIAVVAQKVKVQCCYIMADMLNLKKWGGGGGGSVVGQDGY